MNADNIGFRLGPDFELSDELVLKYLNYHFTHECKKLSSCLVNLNLLYIHYIQTCIQVHINMCIYTYIQIHKYFFFFSKLHQM